MYTTVKLRDKAKKKLEELQARLRLYGIKASLHEILEKLIDIGLDNIEYLINRFRGIETVRDPMLDLLEKPVDWGVSDSSIKVDEYLYGGGSVSIHRHRSIRSSKE